MLIQSNFAAGWFPANYVEEMDIDSIAHEEADDKDNPLGSLEKFVLNVSGMYAALIFHLARKAVQDGNANCFNRHSR